MNFTLTCYVEGADKIKTTNYFKSDYVTIRETLGQVNWVSQLRENFLTAYVNFLNVLGNAMDVCIPEYENVKNKKNIYMIPEAIRKKNLKSKLWRRYKSYGCKYDRSRYTKVKDELRSFNQEIKNSIRKRHR